jgi:L-alanine-DL-glutamate epimerase-like enolase superfamily enzyme
MAHTIQAVDEGNRMKIERIDATHFTIPYKKEVRFATGALSAADHVLLRVTTTDGVVGTAELIPRPMIYGDTVSSALGAIESIVRPLLVGRSVGPGHDLRQRLKNLAGNYTVKGALDIALWDAAARTFGVPCWQLLGGDGGEIQVTCMLGLGSPEEVVEEANEMVAAYGVSSFKVKVGLDVRQDIAVCAAMREAFPEALINVDANHGYNFTDAVMFGRAAMELHIAWIEEPSDGLAVAGRERVVRAAGPPIMSDESTPDVKSVAREIIAKRTDLISVKVARTGLTESSQILGICDALGTGVVIGNQGDSDLGTLASLQFGGLSETARERPGELTYFLTALGGHLLEEPPEVRGGRIAIPTAPGLGGEIDEEQFKHYAAA